MRILVQVILTALALNHIHCSWAQEPSWSVELHGGFPWNIPLPLMIRQTNEPVLSLTARYRSEPLRSPYYWIARISRTAQNRTWEVELVHHKLYLKNRPSEVQWFAISHGYNLMMINHVVEGQLIGNTSVYFRMGLGAVLAHPETRIREKLRSGEGGIFNWGYNFTGPVINLSMSKRVYTGKRFFIHAGLGVHPSVSRIPVADGHAIVWNLPLTLTLGPGMVFKKRDSTTD